MGVEHHLLRLSDSRAKADMRHCMKRTSGHSRARRANVSGVGYVSFFFFQAEDGIRDVAVTGVQTCALPICAEECEALQAAGVPFHVVPGVTSAIAVPAAAGIPVTHRRVASGFAVVAGHECDGRSDLDWEALSRTPTLVVLMGLAALPDVVARLRAQGAPADAPVAVIASGTLPEQRTVVGTLDDIAELVAGAGLEPPATLLIGEVVRGGLTQSPPPLVSHA